MRLTAVAGSHLYLSGASFGRDRFQAAEAVVLCLSPVIPSNHAVIGITPSVRRRHAQWGHTHRADALSVYIIITAAILEGMCLLRW